jgi:3-deoxy-D-manno-octulosonic-acid transferase
LRFIYVLAVYLAAPVISTILLWRGLRDRSYWHHFGERFGFGPRLEDSGIWVHAVSVGEVQAAAALVSTLRQRYPEVPVIVTTFTPTGAHRGRTSVISRMTCPARCGGSSIESIRGSP